jgi:hypothetical protein
MLNAISLQCFLLERLGKLAAELGRCVGRHFFFSCACFNWSQRSMNPENIDYPESCGAWWPNSASNYGKCKSEKNEENVLKKHFISLLILIKYSCPKVETLPKETVFGCERMLHVSPYYFIILNTASLFGFIWDSARSMFCKRVEVFWSWSIQNWAQSILHKRLWWF